MRPNLCGHLFLGALIGCAAPRAEAPNEPVAMRRSEALAPSRGAESEPRGALSLQLVLRGPEGIPARALEHRESLPSGSRVALWLTVESQPLWIHAYHRGPRGELERLGQPAQIAAGQLRELPGAGNWYRLEGAEGSEIFYAVATAEPLSPEAQAQLEAALPTGREPPPRSSTSNRIPGPTYQKALDETQRAILSIAVLHQAAP